MPIEKDRTGHLVLGLLLGGLLTGWGVHRIESAARQDLSDAFIVHVADCQTGDRLLADRERTLDEALLRQLRAGDVEGAMQQLSTSLELHRVTSEHVHQWNASEIVGPARARMERRVAASH